MARDPAVVSYNMSRVRSKDTAIELRLRSALWKRGLRYRKHYRRASGTPDVAFPGAKVAVFCDSSFWHGRNWAEEHSRIKSNRDYWIPKIERNIARDARVNEELAETGWLVLRFWDEEIETGVDAVADVIAEAVASRKTSRHNK